MKTTKNQFGGKLAAYDTPGVRMVLLIAGVMIVLLVLILVYMIIKPGEVVKPRIRIDNFAEVLPKVPEKTKQSIEERLYEQVAMTVKEGATVPESGAMIRKGTIDGLSVKNSFVAGDFVVDMGAVEQSYIVEYYYGRLEEMNEIEGDAAVELYCIEDPELVIYDFKCLAKRDFVKPDAISFLLPKMFDDYALSYTYSSTSESGYAVVVEYDPSESVYMSGKVGEFKAEKMAEIREYIEKAGLDPDEYEYIEKFKVVR